MYKRQPIPSANGSNGFGLAGIKKDVEKAVGVEMCIRDRSNPNVVEVIDIACDECPIDGILSLIHIS